MKKFNISYKLKIFMFTFSISVVCILVTGLMSWVSTSNAFMDRYNERNEVIIKQVEIELQRTMDNLVNQISVIENSTVFNDAKEIGSSDFFKSFVEMSELFFDQKQLNRAVDSMFYYRFDGVAFYDYTTTPRINISNIKNEPWYQKTIDSYPYLTWTPQYEQQVFENRKNTVVTMSKLIYGKNNPAGILVINLTDKYFQDNFKNIDEDKNGVVYILDEANNIISKSGEVSQVFDDFEHSYGVVDNISEIIYYREYENNSWKIVYSVDKSALSDYDDALLIILWSVSIGFLFAFAFMYLNARTLAAPIHEFLGLTQKVREGNIGERWICTSEVTEFRVMADGFNCMVDSINKLLEDIEKEYKLNSELKIKILEEQLNSHFLYNALNSIYYTAASGEAERSADMTLALADFLRHGLNQGNSYTEFGKEIEHVKNYIHIEKFRYIDKFDVEYEIDESALNVVVPKIIIQPLVENSIIHGLFGRESGGLITIKASCDGKYLYIEIIDNGEGIDAEELELINSDCRIVEKFGKSNGLAIWNLKKRFELNYDDYEFKIESEKGMYTKVYMKLEVKDFL